MDDAFKLPDGNVALAFSGGRTSAMMLHEILRVNGDLPERVVVSFQNTGREMPETLDFVQECGERWGVRIVWLEYVYKAEPSRRFKIVNHNSASRDGEPFEALIRHYVGTIPTPALPNPTKRYCTREMKSRAMARHLRSLGWKQYTKAVGIRADEADRMSGGKDGAATIWRPLIAAKIDKRAVSNFWSRQPFDLRLPNINGRTQLGNCDGCFLKSERARAALARDFPERAAWWQRMEELAANMGARGTQAQFREEVTYAQIADMVDRQGDWIFDQDGYLCQADDGECTG